jgi:hypothetical protein
MDYAGWNTKAAWEIHVLTGNTEEIYNRMRKYRPFTPESAFEFALKEFGDIAKQMTRDDIVDLALIWNGTYRESDS